ncbi:MAG: hypothetical protein IRZ28_06930 [Steroidobacteraceae bacterium]|nr:hypothetical protein [Steroidobacteraceae bacterium]
MKQQKFSFSFAIFAILLGVAGTARAEQWKWLIGQEDHYPVCEHIYQRLNAFHWTQELASADDGFYVWSVVASAPGWTQPPWRSLDPWEHQEPVRELIRYKELGADFYFGRTDRPYRNYTEEQLQQYFRNSMKSGVQLGVWRTHLVNWLNKKPTAPGDQTVVEISSPTSKEELADLHAKYPHMPAVARPGQIFLVKDDLSGPDPRPTTHDVSRLRTPLLFGGETYFVTVDTTGHDVEIGQDLGHGPTQLCDIELDVNHE